MVGYHLQIGWLLYTCTFLCLAQLLINLFLKQLQEYAIPYLIACLLGGYFITHSLTEGVCYGLCVYYLTAIVYVGFLLILSQQRLLLMVAIVSIVSYFIHKEDLFIVTSVFCFLTFFISLFRGTLRPFAFDILLGCLPFGIALLTMRDVDTYLSVKLLKGFLWACSTYYIVSFVYDTFSFRKNKQGENV